MIYLKPLPYPNKTFSALTPLLVTAEAGESEQGLWPSSKGLAISLIGSFSSDGHISDP